MFAMQYNEVNKRVSLFSIVACPPMGVIAVALFGDQLAGVLLVSTLSAILLFCTAYLVQHRNYKRELAKKALGGGQRA